MLCALAAELCVAFAVARMTVKRVGIDTATRMAQAAKRQDDARNLAPTLI